MPIAPTTGFRPLLRTPAAPSPTPLTHPNVAQAIQDNEEHGDPESFQVQKDIGRLQQHGTDPKSLGGLRPLFPEPTRPGR